MFSRYDEPESQQRACFKSEVLQTSLGTGPIAAGTGGYGKWTGAYAGYGARTNTQGPMYRGPCEFDRGLLTRVYRKGNRVYR